MARNLSDKEYMVYCHESPDGKRYVGITCLGEKYRWGSKGQGYKTNKHFWRAIQLYGWDNFGHYILFEGLSQEQAESKERELIALWDTTNQQNGYNCDDGGNAGKHLSKETREKLSRATKKYFEAHTPPNLGKHLSEETKKKLSVARMGVKWSSEHREKELARRKANPHKHSEETKAKISKSNMESEKRQRKAVCQYDIDGNFIQTYKSIREAVRETGIDRQQLSACCNKMALSAGGFFWCFVDGDIQSKVEVPKKNVSNSSSSSKYLQYSLDGVLLAEYENKDQLEKAGYDVGNVRRCCNHIRKTYSGFKWEYEKEG
jgi:group I intron endonuclease